MSPNEQTITMIFVSSRPKEYYLLGDLSMKLTCPPLNGTTPRELICGVKTKGGHSMQRGKKELA